MVWSWSFSFPPRDSGEGGPRSCAVGGASPCTASLGHASKALHHTPPPPRSAWSPSPASRGRMSQVVLATQLRPSYATPRRKILPEMAKGGGAPEGASNHGRIGEMRLRALRKRARLSALH